MWNSKALPDTVPGKRVTGAGPHTTRGKAKEEGEVHRAPAPHQHRAPRRGVLRTQRECRARRGRIDMASIRGRPGSQYRGPALAASPGSVSGPAVPTGLHTYPNRTAGSARQRSPPLKTRSYNGRPSQWLNAIYEEDFLGFSCGFRPKRGQHDALDTLVVGITIKKVNFILDADIRPTSIRSTSIG